MKEPIWLQRTWGDALHFRQLQRFGGQYGVRDEAAIESALARARNRWLYSDSPDLAALAAAYGYGLTQNQGYVDGNKRVGFVAMAVFMELNGYGLEAEEQDVVQVMLAVASGNQSEEELAAWVRVFSVKLARD